jgi:YVTN family beta-propeller protein
MQNRIQRLIALIFLNIIVLVFVAVLSNFTYAQIASSHSQQLHEKMTPRSSISFTQDPAKSKAAAEKPSKAYLYNQTLYYIAKHTSSSQNAYIPVGRTPFAIDVERNAIYVLNRDGTISVIDGINNTKIGTIHVGESASAIGFDPYRRTIYVASDDSGSRFPGPGILYVIDRMKNTTSTVRVGMFPSAIDVEPDNNETYVANWGGDSVSAIDERTNTVIGKAIPVGNGPGAMYYGNGGLYVANDDGTISVIDVDNKTKIATIPVGTGSSAIAGGSGVFNIYIANSGHGTLSVIDETNNTKIATIPVGKDPTAIDAEFTPGLPPHNRIYVANHDDGTVSVVDVRLPYDLPPKYTKIATIPVGKHPTAIGFDSDTHTVYVANSGDGTLSVINATNNTKIATIPVGKDPIAIGVDEFTNTIYVANQIDNSVSVIDGEANKVVAKALFNIEPFNEGYIECDKIKAPIAQPIYVWSGSQCTAKPYPGFEFVSWQENLGRNATQLISLLPPPSIRDSVLDFATQLIKLLPTYISDSILDFFHMNSDKPEATLSVTKFGNFTAYFRALPPPIPPEYVATLIGVVATAFVGTWLTPALIGWRKTRTQLKYFKECINQIRNREDKNKIEDEIIGYYADGKLSDVHHQLLKDKISEYYNKT